MTMTRRHLYIVILTLIISILTVMPALASGEVKVTFTADRSELTVGDPVQLTLEVNHPAETQVIIPKLEQTWGDFEVRSQSPAEMVTNADGSQTTRQTIEVTLFAPGDFQSPELTLTVSDGAGQITEENVAPVSLTVVPVLAEGDTTLLDIKPQAGLSLPPLWPRIVTGLVIATALAGAGWWGYHRLRRGQLAAAIIDNRLPYEVAYDELARIESLSLPEQSRFKEYYTLVTDCLRRYLEKQHYVRTFDRTTWELRQEMRRSTLSPDHARRFLDLFSESDLVKFAKFVPDLDLARQMTGSARNLVTLTKPVEEIEADSSGTPTPKSPNGSHPSSLDAQSAAVSNHALPLNTNHRR